MTSEKNQKLISWLDLSEHGAQLAAFRFPDGKIRIVLAGLREGGSDWNWAVDTQQFIPTNSRTALFRQGSKIDLAPFLRHFPRAKRVDLPPNKIVRVVTPSNAPTARPLDVDLRAARPLGLNHLGQSVFEGAAGRFIRSQGTGAPAQTENEINSPAVFLRAASEADLALCADGLVEMIVQGSVLRAEDLRRFAGVIFGLPGEMTVADHRLRRVQEAIEAALQRRLQKDVAVPDRNAYDLAVRLLERQPPFIYRTSSSIENQQYSTPLPMSIVAQHIFGSPAGKRYLEPTIGNGSLVSTIAADAEVVGVEIDPARAAQVRQLSPNIEVLEGDFTKLTPGGEFDCVVANPPFGGLKPETVINGLRVTRIDHLVLMRSLGMRKDDGRAVYIIGADRSNVVGSNAGKLDGGSQNLFNWLADHYDVEGVTEIDGRLYEKQGAGYPVRMVVVGRKLTPEETAEAQRTRSRRFTTVPVVRSWDELWDFATKISPAANAASELQLESVLEQPEQEREPQAKENDYQAPYMPASKVGEPTAMIPRNLVAPTGAALDAVERTYGNIDAFVGDRLGMSIDELAAAFSPEQVDAIALGIARAEEGRGLIVGDQTGLGKGRVLAGLARYAAMKNRPVVFLTEKPNLFSDFYRDLIDIDSADLFRPFIVNDGVDIRDQQNKRVVPPTDKALRRRIISDKQSPADEGFNLTFATYTQFNRPAEKSDKSLWLAGAAAAGALLILDESHNAAGESNTAVNVADAVEAAWACGYSSATFAKDAKNMAAYQKAFPAGMTANNIAETLAAGGEPLQEVLSAMLAEDGALVRREHDLSKLAFRTVVDELRRERNEALADQLSSILEIMAAMSGDVARLVAVKQKEIAQELEKLSPEQRHGNRMGVSCTNFGSRLFTLLRQFQIGIKTDMVADEALQVLREGKKPVIVLEQTMESLLNEAIFAESELEIDDDEGVVLATPSLSTTMVVEPITYRDALLRSMDRLDSIVLTNAYGTVERSSAIALAQNAEQADAWRALKDDLRERIMAFPDVPLSPLDVIRERIEAAGFTCGEISGRSLSMTTGDDGKMIVAPRPNDRLKTIHDFNRGVLDAAVLTRAGSTGNSLHASEKFEDQRQRVMLELQIANNVAERLQFFGRVNRKGQVCAPEIWTLASGLPGEMRTLAMQNNKLRKLSANTQSNRSNAAEMKEVPDILNKLGSEICLRYLENNPNVARALSLDLKDVEERMAENPDWLANKVMGHISLLPIAIQKSALAQIFEEYDSILKELDAIGENPFKAQEFDWQAKVTHREILDGSEALATASPFLQPVYLTRVEYEREVTPYTFEEVLQIAEATRESLRKSPLINMATGGAPPAALNNTVGFRAALAPLFEKITRRFAELKSESLSASKFETLAAALSAEGPNPVKNLASRQKAMMEILPLLYPGSGVRVTGPGGDEITGVVVSLVLPEQDRETHPGRYEVRIAIPGEQHLMETTLNGLMASGVQPAYSWPEGARTAKEAFERVPAGKIKFSKILLDGNLFRAAQLATERNLGRTVIYTDENGARRRGVLLKSQFSMKEVLEMPVSVDSVAGAKALIAAGGTLFGDANLDRYKGATVAKDRTGMLVISVPGTRQVGGAIFLNKELLAITGDFAGGRAQMSVRVPAEKIDDVLPVLLHCREFWASADNRDLLADARAAALTPAKGSAPKATVSEWSV